MAQLEAMLDRAYDLAESPHAVTSRMFPPEKLALIFIIFAMGSYYSLELPADDSSVEEYLSLSRCCMGKADFLNNNSIAAIQTLVSFLFCFLFLFFIFIFIFFSGIDLFGRAHFELMILTISQ